VAREVVIGPNAGLNQVIVRCANGVVYAWGWNQSGQLGLGSSTSIVSTPTPIPGLTILVP
jgi:alpha-tubulin suppressor-like RCC1 family protein